MITVYLVRHGITQANKENRFAGRTNEELHAEGIEQIQRVGTLLQDKNITAVYCGPARRTVQSAEILGALLSVPVSPLAGLDEIYIPHWDGLTKDEIRQKYNDEYPTWLESPDTFQLAGCENLQQVQTRAVDAVQSLVKQYHSKSLLVVSHLIVLRCLILYYREQGIKNFRSVKIDNGSILRLSGSEDGVKSIAFI
jgi:broad specificity phosphatase PhoE